MKQELKQFALKHSWQAGMDAKGLDSWDNYSGGMDKPDWVVVVGRNRDSEILAESNFEAALELLGGEGKHVCIERFGHWGCGWFELLLVNPKSVSKLKIAKQIKDGLENYPVIDEDDFYDRENEAQTDYAEGAKDQLAEGLVKHLGLKPSKQLTAIAFELNIECQRYYGNDSCINVYPFRAPDASDIERVRICLNQMKWNFDIDGKTKLDKTYRELCEALGMAPAKVIKAKRGDDKKIGVHLLAPTEREIEQARETAARDGFKVIYLHTKRTWPQAKGNK